MVVRSIREHAAKQNWFGVAVDLVILIVGVFLGMQANNWNNDRLERTAAENYRVEITDNLRANVISLDDQIAYYEQVNAHAAAALDAFENPVAAGEAFIVNAYQATQIRQRQLTGTAYDEMQNAGIGRLIGDEKARALLSSYYAQLPQINDNVLVITGFRDKVRSAIPFRIQRRIRETCGDQLVNLPLGVVGARLAKDCRLDLSPQEKAQTIARLRALPGFDQDLTRRIADVDTRLGMLRSLRDRAKEVLDALRAPRT